MGNASRGARLAAIVVGGIGLVLLLAACDPPPVYVFGVDSTADRVDATPGDGRCATAAPEVCTLRAAVMEANALGQHTQVLLPPGTVRLSLGSGDENAGVSDDLDVRVALTVTGDAVAGSTIDAGGVGRVLDVITGTTSLTHVTVTGGSTTGSGGGVSVRTGARVVAEDVTIAGNTSAGTGGLKLQPDSSADLTRVTISGNTGAGNGGVVNAGTLVARNSTISGNVATDGTGGGIATPAPGTSTLTFTTVTANTGSGLDGDGTATLAGSIVADQTSGADCTGTAPASSGRNLDGDGTCLTAPAAGDVVAGDPKLGPLAQNGGATRTHRPLTGSQARDAIPTGTAALCDGTIATDQRGRARPTFGGCDIGSVETGDLVVNRSTDGRDVAPGDGVCEVTTGADDCTLRAAIDEANATPGRQEVVLQSDVTLSRPGGGENLNATGDLDVRDALAILGGGHTIDGGGLERVLQATAPLTIERATIRGANLGGPAGGAGILASADLTLRFTTVRDNTSASSGGGINHTGGALVVEDSTITGNVVTSYTAVAGGGIRSTGASASLLRSTISKNVVTSDQGGGGGLSRVGSPASVVWSTIDGNRAGNHYQSDDYTFGHFSGAGGGGIAGPVDLVASTVSGNWSGGSGGGLAGAPITIRSSTITGNEAVGASWDLDAITYYPHARGGAVDGTATVVASTIIGNSAVLEFDGISGGSLTGSIHTDSCAPGVTSGGWNVVSEGCARSAPGDVVVPEAQLPVVEALADNGGPTKTMLPTAVVLDGIPAGTPGLCDAATTVDQRGRVRPAGAACDSGSVERSTVASVSLVTNSSADARDKTPGDGICATAADACTLRAAIDEANLSSGADTITLGVDAALTVGGTAEDGNATGDLDIGTDLTVEGAGHAIDGTNIDRVLHQRSGNLTLHQVVVRRGSLHGADTAGGLVLSSSGGSLTISGSTLADGSAGSVGRGGAISKAAGVLDVSASTITGTTAGTGAAVALDGGTATFTHVTVAGSGPGAAVVGSGISASRSIVASSAGGACGSPFASSTWNLVTDATCGGALITDPHLGPLALNGGPTPTRVPDAGSDAINAIPVGEPGACDATAPADQRGVARPQGLGCDLGATETDDGSAPPVPTLVVNRSTDAHDTLPGDGLCAIAGGGCTLRAAVDEANARPGLERIELTVDVTLSLPGTGEDANATGDIDVRSPIQLDGGGHRINGSGLDRVLDVRRPLTLTAVKITGGYTNAPGMDGYGAGVQTRADLSLSRVEVYANQAVIGDGGGIGVNVPPEGSPRPVVTVTDSTIAGNRAESTGGLGLEWAQSATVLRSTISGNIGYYAIGGPIHLVTSTVVDNTSTMSIGYGVIDVRGSIISAPGPACATVYGKPASLGYNVADSSCQFASIGDRVADALPLAPLADNGGPTRTRLPYAGSPGIDAIPPGTVGLCDAAAAVDQRGAARPAGPACDIGAVEGDAGPDPTEQVLTVTSGADLVDAAPGDGACLTSAGTCTLRAAIGEGNSRPGPARIVLQADVTLGLAGGGDDLNATGDLDVRDRTRIEGGDHVVNAAAVDRVFQVIGGPLELVRVSVRGGSSSGGVRVDDGFLLIESSTVTANGGTGVVVDHSMAVVRASTISGNVSGSGSAGGIQAVLSVVQIDVSTISGNSSPSGAGLAGSSGRFEVRRSTFAANTGGSTFGGDLSTSYSLRGSIISAPPGSACYGTTPSLATSFGWNVVSDTSCALTGTGDQQGVAIALGPLAANGGPTRTHLLTAGSVALDAIPVGTAGLCDATTPPDQRGVARPAGAGCDIGAVEGTTAFGPGAPAAPEGDGPTTPEGLEVVATDPSGTVVPDAAP